MAVRRDVAQNILVIDSRKSERIGTFNAAPAESLNTIVTNASLPELVRDAIRDRGIALHIAATARE